MLREPTRADRQKVQPPLTPTRPPGLRLPRRLRRTDQSAGRPGDHLGLPDPVPHHRRRPLGPRRLRQGQDGLGQDARLRAADAPAHRGHPAPGGRGRHAARRRAPRPPRALVLLPTRELAVQVFDVLEPPGRGGGPAGGRRLRGARTSSARSSACARASRSSSARPAGSSISATGASCPWPTSRSWSSTRPTGWPTWASCPKSNGCCAASSGPTRPCCSRPPSTGRSTGWSPAT